MRTWVELPIGSDLSAGSLAWAIELAVKNEFGCAKKVLFGVEGQDFNAVWIDNLEKESKIKIHLSECFPERWWLLVCERGGVLSKAPN